MYTCMYVTINSYYSCFPDAVLERKAGMLYSIFIHFNTHCNPTLSYISTASF
jgi:hypothetical protein